MARCQNGNGPDLKSEASFGMSGFDSYSRRKKKDVKYLNVSKFVKIK